MYSNLSLFVSSPSVTKQNYAMASNSPRQMSGEHFFHKPLLRDMTSVIHHLTARETCGIMLEKFVALIFFQSHTKK